MGYFKRGLIFGAIGLLCVLAIHSFFGYVARYQDQLSPVRDVYVSSAQDGVVQGKTLTSLPVLLQNSTSELRRHDVSFNIPSAVLAAKDAQVALFSPHILHGGDFYLNGEWFYGLPASSEQTRYAWYTPLIAPIPQALLKEAGQNNLIEIRFASFQRGFVVPSLYVGALEPTYALFRLYQFISTTLSSATNVFCWVVGLFMIAIWIASGTEPLFGYAGGATILWATLFTLALTTEISIDNWLIWRFLLYISTGGLVLLMSMFLFEYAQTRLNTWIKSTMAVAAVGVPFIFLVWGRSVEFWLDYYWTGVIISLYIVATVNLIRKRYKSADSLTVVLLGYSVIATIFAYHDYGAQAGPLITSHDTWVGLGIPLLMLEPIFLTHFTLPLLLVITGVILLRMHVANIGLIRNANETLEFELIKRERELEEIHTQQKIIISENAINKERNRILQDIHDGLGSRLINVLLEVRTDQTSPKVLALDIQACIEDLRLLVSGQFVDDAPFTEVLDEFCQRAARNLRSVGVQLHHDLDWIDKGELQGLVCLNILRIIQEMVSNTIKHSQAKNCSIKMKKNQALLMIDIWDDGIGFDVKDNSFRLKRGMLGINKRIAELAGESELVSNATGTRLKIRLDMMREKVFA